MSATASVAILAGGSARRFGRDKLIEVVDGRPLAAGVIELARAAGARRIMLVGHRRAALDHPDIWWVPDRWPGSGPLGAVITALTAVDTDVIAIPGDLVGLDVGVLSRLLDAGLTEDDAVVVSTTGDLHGHFGMARWNRQCCERLEQLYAGGMRSLTAAFEHLAVRVLVGGDTVRDIDVPGDIGSRPTSTDYDRGDDRP